MSGRSLKLTLQYDGTAYAGFQRQPNGVSIQERLEDALRALTGDPEFKIGAAAGRTDAGVHAAGQVVHIVTTSTVPTANFARALNTKLPDDIACTQVEEVDAEFHARYSVVNKCYRYTVDNGPIASPLYARYAAHWAVPLDIERMRAAAALLVGYHDFAAFRSSGGAAKTSDRTIRRLEVAEEYPLGPLGPRLVRMETEADGFLYNMVRILAGTLVEVGSGRRLLADVAAALATADRKRAGKTLPPQGLCLMWVDYGHANP